MPKDIEPENNINKHALSDIFYGDFMNTIRESMERGEQVPGCIRCYQEEESGKKSLRQRYNTMNGLDPRELIIDNIPKIKWLELAIGNDCNLACRMCDSRYAWKWFNDELDFEGTTASITEHTKADINSIDAFLDDIVHIKFTGGEPFLIPDHFVLLDKLSTRENVADIYLNYSTNLTIMPKQDTINKWKKFKYIEFACSLDGIGPTWDLIRYPSNWHKAQEVTSKIISLTNDFNCRVGLRSTISVNNILNMPETYDWWIENWNTYANKPFDDDNWMNPTHLTYPDYLSTTVLPSKYKDIVASKLEQSLYKYSDILANTIKAQLNHMYSKDDTHLLPKLKDYTLHFDKKRNQNFFIVNPELKGLFDGI